jgi:hypothetical protein
VDAWLVARRTEAVHVHVGQLPQLADEELDVDAGSAVDIGWVLAGEHSDAHGLHASG